MADSQTKDNPMTPTVSSLHITIYNPDGTLFAGNLSEREARTVVALDKALQADVGFHKQYPEARLERLEVMRGVLETVEGHYYLCYRSGGQLYEFWGNLSDAVEVRLEDGLVSVREEDIS